MKAPDARRVLLLQGPPSPFFGVLARQFKSAGIPVTKIKLHAGDGLRAGEGIGFTGKINEFAPFLRRVMRRHAITDVLYFADRLPYHRVAEKVAGEMGATPYAVENGYIRPDWLTLEPGGMGAFSRFPTDRNHIEAIADGAPPVDDSVLYSHSFTTEAYYDVSYTLFGLAAALRYPHYERDRDNHPLKEYFSWLPQLVRRNVARKRAPRQLARVLAENRPFFLFPMQLQEDYQIRHNSRYTGLATLVDDVFSSFARTAPEEALLLIKIHPLDNGLQNWRQIMKDAKRKYGLTGRIRLLAAGSLPEMLAACEGVVLVNSTVGLTALRAGKPTKAMGAAVYDLPGLTSQQSLDEFWQKPAAPDMAYVETFVRALAAATQLKGSFYDPAGINAGADEIVRRVATGIGSSSWFVSPPPRLEKAAAMGVPLDPPVGRARIMLEV
ncbi:capsular biosynthesis protein [Acuticoccus sp. MNP-M23]|uniref:capsule biosynthesis protein n=1 Tax=Acuticoccus sp. MNP-M23 TaxID=3072793 RepID=UPI00281601E4|nr:capsular biosynthesis protein [Acuticoccus sp. MNP-M23]WMS41508.1 capsular biosynthesis protein [Acuticoccus sp. MNP-M23]